MSCKHGVPEFGFCKECCREISDTVSKSDLIGLLAGYLVEWTDFVRDFSEFFTEERFANTRRDEVLACGFETVTVTPLYRKQ